MIILVIALSSDYSPGIQRLWEMTKKRSSNRRNSASLEQSLVAEIIASNVDLLTEILLRLPAKSLIRFKCVSKHWLNLISDYQFACNHACQNRNSLISGIYWKSQSEEQVKFVSLHGQSSHPTLAFLNYLGEVSDYSHLYIHNSCNGLMMCSHSRAAPFIVCNLTTRKYTVVPYPSSPFLPSFTYHTNRDACLAFDPSKSPHFKVVVVAYSYKEHSYEIVIYSSTSASWKHKIFPFPYFCSVGHKVYCNGAIHWICKKNSHFRFELDAEELIETSIPPKPKILDDVNIPYLGECCGRLLLIQIPKFSAEGFRILETDTDYCRWTVKHRVNLRPVIALFPKTVQTNRRKFSVLSVVEEANKKDCSLLLGISGKIISYNLKTKTWKVLRDDFPPKEFTEYFDGPYIRGHQFIESLSPV